MATEQSFATVEVLDAVTAVSKEVARLESQTKAQHDEKMRRLVVIEDQVKHTNGRVTKLEQEQLKREAIEEYKREHEVAAPKVEVTQTNVNAIDWQKIVLAVIGVAMTVLSLIAGLGAK